MSLILGLMLLQPVEETIVVTGRGLPDEPPGQHRIVITSDALDRSASGRMEDVLRSVAGLTSFRRSDARSSHPTSQGLTARGLGGNAASRFAVEVDGVPQSDPFGGWINFIALDPAFADRVVVARGGQGGVTAGPGAVAGTLMIDSLTGRDDPQAGGLALGSRDSVSAFATTTIPVGQSRIAGGLSFQRGDGFAPIVEADRGAVDRRAPYRQLSGRLRFIAPLRGAELQASASLFDDRRDRGVDFTDNRGRGIDLALRMVGPDWSLTGFAQRRRFASEFASVTAGRSSVSPALDQFSVPASGWGAKAVWQPRLGPVAATLGGDLRATQGETNERFLFAGGEPQRQRRAGAETLTAGLFADGRWQSAGTSLGLGARIDRWSISGARLEERTIAGAPLTDIRFDDRNGLVWSMRGGLDQRLSPGLALRAAGYRSWRLPTVNELVRPFRVGLDATAANAGLDPERLSGIEAGLDWQPSAKARLSVTAYFNRLAGAIANVPIASGPGTFPGVGFVAGGGTYRRRENLDAIVARGVEIDGGWSAGPWTLGGSLALTRSRIRDDGLAAALDGLRPAQVPSVQATASAAWQRHRRLASLVLRYTGRQDESEGDVQPLPAALTLDAVGRLPLGRGLSLDLRAENVFDRRVIASILPDGTRERAGPRTLWLGIRLH